MQVAAKPKLSHFVILGIILGILTVFLRPTIFAIGVCFYFLRYIKKSVTLPSEQKFIFYSCVFALLLRIVVSIFLLSAGWISEMGSDIVPDAVTYEGVGAYIKELATGKQIEYGLWGDNMIVVLWLRKVWQGIDERMLNVYSIPAISYLFAYFNSLWGVSFLANKILNGLIWIISCFWLYLFFKDRFGLEKFHFGFLVSLLLPTSVIFSASGSKDSFLFFLIIASIYSVHMLEQNKHRFYAGLCLLLAPLLNIFIFEPHFKAMSFHLLSLLIITLILLAWNPGFWLLWGALLISAIPLLYPLRAYVYVFVLFFGFLIILRKLNYKKVFWVIFLILALATFFSKGLFLNNLKSRLVAEFNKRKAESVLQSYNTARGRGEYRIYPQGVYVQGGGTAVTNFEAFLAFLKGLRFIFLEPTPWTFPSKLAIAMFPETLFLWLCIPFMLIGIGVILRIDSRMALVTLTFLFMMTFFLAMGEGNIGTLIRLRLMILPWYFMIGSLGLHAALSNVFRER